MDSELCSEIVKVVAKELVSALLKWAAGRIRATMKHRRNSKED